jgi:hypothetical protein
MIFTMGITLKSIVPLLIMFLSIWFLKDQALGIFAVIVILIIRWVNAQELLKIL